MSFENGFSDEYFSHYDDVAQRMAAFHRVGREFDVDDTVALEMPQIEVEIARSRCGRLAGPCRMKRNS